MRTLIAIPCMDTVQTQFFISCLRMRTPADTEYTVASGSLIYDARNQLAKKAVTEGFDRVLWLDSDMTFSADLFERMSFWLDAGLEFVSGMYFKRKAPFQPVVYQFCGMTEENGEKIPKIIPFSQYPADQLFEIEACGFGAVMMTTDLIRKVLDQFGLPFFPAMGFGEDLAFCLRARAAGAKLWCDSNIKLGHIGQIEFNEQIILEGMKWNADI